MLGEYTEMDFVIHKNFSNRLHSGTGRRSYCGVGDLKPGNV
ncbi:hypothetical protein GCM10007096_30250 [Pullulanibacillus pueri]|uniref:Uncharacterized protein n=1 Tax=Pullulanibacillus pueri TaxID=1437324 RepID=A0A8J2ZYH7_9BACL|nr:hypothetical protein GCM10007096_30250 [Pullulanibacillus pueri]